VPKAAKRKPRAPERVDPRVSYTRHLAFDHLADPGTAGARERFEAVAYAVREVLTPRWLETLRARAAADPKRVYYLSMEYLVGRSLSNNLVNLGVEAEVRKAMEDEGLDWDEIVECEADAGLGNGGLGRLAACFVDSLATLGIPAIGYGLRYEYGIFRQAIRDGWQKEHPDAWLLHPDPFEVPQANERVEIKVNCTFEMRDGEIEARPGRPSTLIGIPYDRPVVGYGGETVNTLRLWGSATPEYFDFDEFSSGDIVGAVDQRIVAEAITRVLYPNDATRVGRALRFFQEYFLVACSLADVVHRFRRAGNDWAALPEKAAIQLNDTHPSLAVAELMRILLDRAGLGWDDAWELTRKTLAFTNHTLLPEALEKWPVRLFETLVPRLLEIVYEINRRFLDVVRVRFPGDDARVRRMSLVEEEAEKKIRMAHLAVVGTHMTNGVSEIHSRLLARSVLSDFAETFPERFCNKTNGVTPRRWLLLANPGLARLVTDGVGEGWVTDLSQLRRLSPLASDAAFREAFRRVKRAAKESFADWLRSAHGVEIDPDSIFDCHVKRIHEYKRQLLNVLHVLVLYGRLRANPSLDVTPRTFFFAGKAAPSYAMAKLVIKLVHCVGAFLEADPAARDKIRVIFVPNYGVTLAQRIIPAADVSEQISTAGFEASGTGNMKFMMNGALTIGTRDGATIEMAREAGEENLFLFGLTADEIEDSRSWYDPRWHYGNEPETRAALDLLSSESLSPGDPGLFAPIREALLDRGDPYRHLADLASYAAEHASVEANYREPGVWTAKAIRNVAASGRFSSDRTIAEYARDVWDVRPFSTSPR